MIRKEKCEAAITIIEVLMKDFDHKEIKYIYQKLGLRPCEDDL